MAHEYPEDEFDRLAKERTTVGAHRRPSSARPWLIALLAVLMIAPIVGIWIGNAMSSDDDPTADEPTASEQAAAEDGESEDGQEEDGEEGPAEASDSEDATDADEGEAAIEPNLNHHILVLNGRGTVGFAGENQAILEQQGFGNVSVADYRGGTQPVDSTIYYFDPEYEGTARAVAEVLGADVAESEDVIVAYGAPIVAVIR
ncbi:hypothetical protein J2S70_000775 [Trueperella bonasi]|uniref:LytR/CpsA/Psr regulator C-terminal domain-containing protein n=1 Tax=Trueperella bonasi TaxID=312286 RepID=A0ABT9NHC4_9ACTO|nr:LytR C-terminal domain-containing protein [Trueperella bonasi]MDP9806193.1 hypothetical protein [Trueperella bonasi]